MKLYLYTLLFALITAVPSFASDVISARSEISSKLNAIVKDLKENFRDTDTLINNNSNDVKVLEEQVNDLVIRSGESETNPTILKHGKASVSKLSSCDYNSENLHWNGLDWACQEVNVLSDCSPASDEYRVSTGSGSYSCQKNQSGSVINYYWKFTGNSITCSQTTGLYGKVYGCYYKNKLNKEVQVAGSNCKGSKPSIETKTCKANWDVSSWSSCSNICGGGIQTRTVTCPTGKVCLDTKPEVIQSCNAQRCPVKPNLTCRGVKVGGFLINHMTTRCRTNQAYSDPNPIIHGKCCTGNVGACAGGGGCGVPTVYIKPKMNCPSGYKLSGTMCY